MKIDETTYKKMPAELQALFIKLPNYGSQEVMELFPDRKSGGIVKGTEPSRTGQNGIYGNWGRVANKQFNDSGSAARFFYCAKASKKERNMGCEELGGKRNRIIGGQHRKCVVCGNETIDSNGLTCKHTEYEWVSNVTAKSANNHPTVKPLALMEYLVKLVKMPEYNLILDPFCGSGTTLLACKRLDIQCIGIDSDEKSCEIAAKRCSAS